MALNVDRLRSIIESMLLVSSDPLPFVRILEVVHGEDPATPPELVKQAVLELIERYGQTDRSCGQGLRVEDVGSGFQLRSTPENAAYVRRLLAARPQRLSKAALETLAIVAYRQPVTKPEVEAIRGVDVGATLKALLDRDLLRILGKKEEVGRPILYGTTQKFLELFGLRSLGALPTLREYQDLDPEHQKQVDELYEGEGSGTRLSDLASTAQFLMERDDDPDLEQLDRALAQTERVHGNAQTYLDQKETEEAPQPSEAPVLDESR